MVPKFENITVYHTPIVSKAIAKNGSNRFGAFACCTFWVDKKKLSTGVQMTMHGDSIEDAVQKLKNLLTSGGNNKLVVVESNPTFANPKS